MTLDPTHFEREMVKVDDRLRSLELQQQKNATYLEGEVTNIVRLMSEVRDILKRHDTMFFGTNGNAGMMTRLDRLEQSEKSRQWFQRAVAVTSVGLVLKIFWDIIISHGALH
jgi:hypothetical protein